MVLCVVCGVKESSYKCPTCKDPYCSVVCYKTHKAQETQAQENTTTASKVSTAGEAIEVPLDDEKDVEPPNAHEHRTQPNIDDTVLRMLQYPSLKQHLQLIAWILQDPTASGEQTTDGRRAVALKKLRELRKGGREENELVEEFVSYISKLG